MPGQIYLNFHLHHGKNCLYPFQILDNESSISDPIVITVANDNSAPEITNSIIGYTILEDDSSELNYTNIDAYIDVTDSDEDTFTLVINQEDINSDSETYSNYSLIGETTIVPDDNYYGQITVPIRLDDGYTVNGDCYNCLSDISDFINVFPDSSIIIIDFLILFLRGEIFYPNDKKTLFITYF